MPDTSDHKGKSSYRIGSGFGADDSVLKSFTVDPITGGPLREPESRNRPDWGTDSQPEPNALDELPEHFMHSLMDARTGIRAALDALNKARALAACAREVHGIDLAFGSIHAGLAIIDELEDEHEG